MAIIAPQAVAPALATALFAFSIKSGSLGGNMFWLLLIAFGILSCSLRPNPFPATDDFRHPDIVGALHTLTLQEPPGDSDGMQK
jgi:hypothetical protein